MRSELTYNSKFSLPKAGIPRRRHGHRHQHGHSRRLPREDRREDVGVSGDFAVQLAEHARGSSPTCPTRAIFLARMSVRDARVYTCTVHDKLSCTRLQNYTIGAPLMSVSVFVLLSVPWNSSLTIIARTL